MSNQTNQQTNQQADQLLTTESFHEPFHEPIDMVLKELEWSFLWTFLKLPLRFIPCIGRNEKSGCWSYLSVGLFNCAEVSELRRDLQALKTQRSFTSLAESSRAVLVVLGKNGKDQVHLLDGEYPQERNFMHPPSYRNSTFSRFLMEMIHRISERLENNYSGRVRCAGMEFGQVLYRQAKPAETFRSADPGSDSD